MSPPNCIKVKLKQQQTDSQLQVRHMFSPSSSSFWTVLSCCLGRRRAEGSPDPRLRHTGPEPPSTLGDLSTTSTEWNDDYNEVTVMVCFGFFNLQTFFNPRRRRRSPHVFQHRLWVRVNGTWPLTFGCSPVDGRAGVAAPRGVCPTLKEQQRQGRVAPGTGLWQRSGSIHCGAVNLLTHTWRRLADRMPWPPHHTGVARVSNAVGSHSGRCSNPGSSAVNHSICIRRSLYPASRRKSISPPSGIGSLVVC